MIWYDMIGLNVLVLTVQQRGGTCMQLTLLFMWNLTIACCHYVGWMFDIVNIVTCCCFSHIAAMMASADLNAIIASLQMAFLLMGKLPDVYRIQFRREGNSYLALAYHLCSWMRWALFCVIRLWVPVSTTLAFWLWNLTEENVTVLL